MNADVITNLDYPHGTVEGFQGGFPALLLHWMN